MKPIIKINHLSKQYHPQKKQLYYTLRDVLANIYSYPLKLLSHPSPPIEEDYFYALKDINLSVQPGEIVGIIGPNGAGKSTLLKILSRITPPSSGTATIRGRVGSMLEVGTGFHQELTGRENIFLYGSILGMKKAEIKSKVNQIIDFAEIEEFIDIPVKHYSSGMFVRLAFSVAAHLEPDILIVDEVLSVGDVHFQKKSLGKMSDISSQSGRTILFVSHNMDTIKNLCSRAIWLEHGQMKMDSTPQAVIQKYLVANQNSSYTAANDKTKIGKITSIKVGQKRNNLAIDVGFTINQAKKDLSLGFILSTLENTYLINITKRIRPKKVTVPTGNYMTTIEFDLSNLRSNILQIKAFLQFETVFQGFDQVGPTLFNFQQFRKIGSDKLRTKSLLLTPVKIIHTLCKKGSSA